MNDQDMINLAREYCKHFHDGVFRKGSNQPYHTHPMAVAAIMDKFGYSDAVTQCVALLHDVVEDTEVITTEIRERFGYEIANGVFVLSKNTISDETMGWLGLCLPSDVNSPSNEDLYKIRLSFARRKIKRVKIADVIHNTQDLASLNLGGIERKLNDAQGFYIPMGRMIAPLMVKDLEKNIDNYSGKISS